VHPPVPVAEFEHYVNEMKANENYEFQKEYDVSNGNTWKIAYRMQKCGIDLCFEQEWLATAISCKSIFTFLSERPRDFSLVSLAYHFIGHCIRLFKPQ
jgi:hypothetical protein